jgi:hypothetical protein
VTRAVGKRHLHGCATRPSFRRPADWSASARWFAGIRPVKLEMDAEALMVLAGG